MKIDGIRGFLLIICLFLYIASAKDFALVGIIALCSLFLATFIEGVISIYNGHINDKISELSDKLNDIDEHAAKFNKEIIDELNTKIDKHIIDESNNEIKHNINEFKYDAIDKISVLDDGIKEIISEIFEYEYFELPNQDTQVSYDGYFEYCVSIKLKKIMLEIANLTPFEGSFSDNESQKVNDYQKAVAALTYVCTESYLLRQVPDVITKLDNDQRRNFINYYNSFRSDAISFGVLSQYDDVRMKINAKEEKHKAIDILLDNIFILKKQNDFIVSRINSERIKSDTNYFKKELIDSGIIEENSLDFDYNEYKNSRLKRIIYYFFLEQLNQNYTIQQDIKSCEFTLDLVITNISTKKSIVIEDEPKKSSSKFFIDEEQRQRILEANGWKFYHSKYLDWISKEFDQSKVVSDIIKLLD